MQTSFCTTVPESWPHILTVTAASAECVSGRGVDGEYRAAQTRRKVRRPPALPRVLPLDRRCAGFPGFRVKPVERRYTAAGQFGAAV
jgi:hypothetical protein